MWILTWDSSPQQSASGSDLPGPAGTAGLSSPPITAWAAPLVAIKVRPAPTRTEATLTAQLSEIDISTTPADRV